MENIKYITLLEDRNKTDLDDFVLKRLCRLIDEDVSLDAFIRNRIDNLADSKTKSNKNQRIETSLSYQITGTTIDFLKVMPEDTTYPILFGRDEDIDIIIYKTNREGVYVIVRNSKYYTDNKDIRLLSLDLYRFK